MVNEENTKSFPLRVVLTVTTGRLLTEPKGPHDNGIGALYELLNWITGDNLFTHQLPRAGRAARPWLLKCFPELIPVNASMGNLDEWIQRDNTGGQEGIKMWLAELKLLFPGLREFYDVAPMPEGWTTIDPLIEAESMFSKDKIIAVEV